MMAERGISVALAHGSTREYNRVFDESAYTALAVWRTDFGRATASIRLSTSQPMVTSVC